MYGVLVAVKFLSPDCALDIVGSTVLRWNETSTRRRVTVSSVFPTRHHLLLAVCFAGTALGALLFLRERD